MKTPIHKLSVCSLLVLAVFVPVFMGFFSIYENGKINNDGSGTMEIVYSGSIKEVEDNHYALGHFPFGKEKISENFSSSGVEITNLKISKPGDTAYMVRLDLKFNKLTALNDLKGMSDFNIALNGKEEGTELNWKIKSNERTKMINSFQIILNFDSEIESSMGNVNGKTIKWFRDDFEKDAALNFVVKADLTKGQTGTNTESKTTDESALPENPDATGKKKCGWFGIELPVIFFLGVLLPGFYRRKRLP